jgi:hypothetical protein
MKKSNYFFAETVEEEENVTIRTKEMKWLKIIGKNKGKRKAAADEVRHFWRTLYRKKNNLIYKVVKLNFLKTIIYKHNKNIKFRKSYIYWFFIISLIPSNSCSVYNFTGTGKIDAETFQVNFFK